MAIIAPRTVPLPLGTTIGAVLSALIDAQADSARTTIAFLNSVGFVPDPAGGPDRLRSVSFTYTKKDENDQRADFTVEIPLLAMVEIPTIAIRKAEIAFDYDITAVTRTEGQAPRAVLAGVVRKVTGSETETTSLSVRIEIEQGRIPVGIEKTLDILELAASQTKATPP
jgi:hypothetical protein